MHDHHDKRGHGGRVALYSPDETLYQVNAIVPVAAGYQVADYHQAVGCYLTQLGQKSVDHLCRGLEGVEVQLKDGGRIVLSTDSEAVYSRVCRRLISGSELNLCAALIRDVDTSACVMLVGSATPHAVSAD